MCTLKQAKELSKSFGNRTKYPTPGHERLVKVEPDGSRVWLQNHAGKLRLNIQQLAGVFTSFYHA